MSGDAGATPPRKDPKNIAYTPPPVCVTPCEPWVPGAEGVEQCSRRAEVAVLILQNPRTVASFCPQCWRGGLENRYRGHLFWAVP